MATQDGESGAETQALSGGDEYGSEPDANQNDVGGADNPVWSEYIDIDFFINITEFPDDVQDKLAQVFVRTCEIKPEQVTEINTTIQPSRTRITLRIITDEWEMPTVSKKVQSLIPEQLLSQSLHEIFELDKKPRVTQFYSKSSTNAIPTISQPDKYPYDSEERRASTRDSLAKAKENGDVDSAMVESAGQVDQVEPSNQGCGCNIL